MKNRLNRNILFLSLFATLISCNKEISNIEFEKNVMTEIFPSLIDSTCIDSRLFIHLPPVGKAIFDSDGNYIGLDTTNIKIERQIWEKEVSKIKNDTSKIIIGFDPIIKTIEIGNFKELIKYFGKQIIQDSLETKNEKFRIDFENVKLNQKFKLKDISKFPKHDRIFETKYGFIFSGIVSFSRIQFDKSKKYGVLSAGFVCGRRCGQGFRIFIKKVNEKWVIDKTEGTWVS